MEERTKCIPMPSIATILGAELVRELTPREKEIKAIYLKLWENRTWRD